MSRRKEQPLEHRLLLTATFCLLAGLFAFYSMRLAWQSRVLNDISTGNDATPLWVPQLAMAVGTVVLLIAFIDEWLLELRGRRGLVEPEEALHNE